MTASKLTNEERDALTVKADRGDVNAQYALGELWAKSETVNWVDAYSWYSLAAKNGHAQAIPERDKAGKHLSASRKDEVDKRVEDWQPKPSPRFYEGPLLHPNMIPAGYMLKKVEAQPEWIQADGVKDIYSVSSCMSDNFADYINSWKHNGYWLFDSPEIVEDLAKELSVNSTALKLFYYEVFESEFDAEDREWLPFNPEKSFVTNVQVPVKKNLEGFDVVTFFAGASPEHSPLSCNGVAKEVPVNEHCLLHTFDDAKRLLEEGRFDTGEPGPLRIFAVYSVDLQ